MSDLPSAKRQCTWTARHSASVNSQSLSAIVSLESTSSTDVDTQSDTSQTTTVSETSSSDVTMVNETRPFEPSPRDLILDFTIHHTFGYTRASQNHIDDYEQGPLSIYRLQQYVSIFIFDVLQLPDTLASVLNYPNAVDIFRFMTRGTLTGPREVSFRLGYVRSVLGLFANMALPGMVLMGLGTTQLKVLDDHYGLDFQRTVVQVNIRLASYAVKTLDAYAWVPIRDVDPRPESQDTIEW